MAYNWAGIGGNLGQGISQGIMQAMQPMFDMKALEYKANQLAKLTTPHWEGLSPEQKSQITSDMLTKLAAPKPDPFERMASMMGAMGGSMMNGQQPVSYEAPAAINPVGLSNPSFKVGDSVVDPKDGTVYKLTKPADISEAIRNGFQLYTGE